MSAEVALPAAERTVAELLGLFAELDLRALDAHRAELGALASDLARSTDTAWWWDDRDDPVVTIRALSRLLPTLASESVTRLYVRLATA